MQELRRTWLDDTMGCYEMNITRDKALTVTESNPFCYNLLRPEERRGEEVPRISNGCCTSLMPCSCSISVWRGWSHETQENAFHMLSTLETMLVCTIWSAMLHDLYSAIPAPSNCLATQERQISPPCSCWTPFSTRYAAAVENSFPIL